METPKIYNITFQMKHDNLTNDELWDLAESLRDEIEDKHDDIDFISVGEDSDEDIVLSNPIIDNRMVSSYTYAVRNLLFLCSVYNKGVPTPTYSGIDEEEFEYMCWVACDLIRHQVRTCPDSEKWYFENLVNGYKDGNDIIVNFVCKNRPEFLNFLKALKAI